MRVLMKWLADFLVSSPSNGQIFRFNSSNNKWQNQNFPKVFIGTGTVSGGAGNVTVDLSSAGFTSAPQVIVGARSTSTATDDRNFASVRTVSATSVSINVSNAVSVGLLLNYVMQNAANGTVVDVVAIGY